MTQDQYYNAIAKGAEDLGLSPGDYAFIGTSSGDGVLFCHFYDSENVLVGAIEVPVS